MKKAVVPYLAAFVALVVLVGCASTSPVAFETGASGSVVVNIEGTVSAVNGKEILLDSGKVLIITDDTVFASQVRDEIQVGSFIQGYTRDDPTLDEVTMAEIYSNVAPREKAG